MAGDVLVYFPSEISIFDKLHRPLPVASIFFPIRSRRSIMMTVFCGSLLWNEIAADSPAAPPPMTAKSKIMYTHPLDDINLYLTINSIRSS